MNHSCLDPTINDRPVILSIMYDVHVSLADIECINNDFYSIEYDFTTGRVIHDDHVYLDSENPIKVYPLGREDGCNNTLMFTGTYGKKYPDLETIQNYILSHHDTSMPKCAECKARAVR